MTLLATLVSTSRELAANPSRLAKVRALADLLRSLAPGEIETAVLYLAGEAPQLRAGFGPALLQSASGGHAASEPTLQIDETRLRLDEVAAIRGAGSQARRSALLAALFAQATAAERDFLVRLLLGDLRQGALAGVMVDAIAAASGVPARDVRRAVMYAGNLGAVARVSMVDGGTHLDQFQLAILSPIAPMLAQTAADVEDALQQVANEATTLLVARIDGPRVAAPAGTDPAAPED